MPDKEENAFKLEESLPTRARSRTSTTGSVSFGHPITTAIIDDTGEGYYETGFQAVMRGISQVLIGMVVTSTCIYSLHKQKFHGALFGLGYHFFVAEAILSLSYVNGWSTPMRTKHRQYVHVLLQLCSMCCIFYGLFSVVLVEETPKWRTIHAFSGLITMVLTSMNWVLGPFVLRRIHGAKTLHMLCGVTCFLMSSLCLGSGIATEVFVKWADITVVAFMLAFISFYSFFIAFATYKKWALRMKA